MGAGGCGDDDPKKQRTQMPRETGSMSSVARGGQCGEYGGPLVAAPGGARRRGGVRQCAAMRGGGRCCAGIRGRNADARAERWTNT